MERGGEGDAYVIKDNEESYEMIVKELNAKMAREGSTDFGKEKKPKWNRENACGTVLKN